MQKTLWCCAALVSVAMVAGAEVKLPAFFSDHMVLQQQAPVPVWGTAAPGDSITVEFGALKKTTKAGTDGRWQVRLDPMPASAESRQLIVSSVGTNQQPVVIADVLVGEVWLCSGQSNMSFPLTRAQNATQEVAAADVPALRLFKGGWQVAATPQSDLKGKWAVCTPDAAAGFSAVAYFFGRDLQKELSVPVGLVQVSCDWTPAEAWMSRAGLEANPEIKKAILDRWDEIVQQYPAKKAEFDKVHAEWLKAKAAAEAEKKPEPPAPKAPQDPNFIHRATGLFNGGIAPLIPYAMRGVIWYQGETNDGRAHQYRKLFPLLVEDWRHLWGQGAFPFLFVQISTAGKPQTLPVTDPVWAADWAELRESQLAGLALTNTAMAVTIDLGDGEVHPANKQDVGKRLALAARAVAYGQRSLVYKGPAYDTLAIEGGKARLRFKDVGGGLVAREGTLKGFIVAGEDRTFVPAEGAIDGDSVLVWSDKVPHPVAVRYAWGNNPPFSLFNKEGLPTSPFRTDDWPGRTYGMTRMFVDENP